MQIITRIFFCALICVLALVVGRSIAHAVTSTGASTYGYDISASSYALQSTDGMTDTVALSVQDDQLVTATPIVLSPYPTTIFLSPTVGLTVTAVSLTPTLIPTVKLTSTPSSTPIPPYVKYTVRRGDTLLKLAESFNTTRQSIIDMNLDVPNLDQLKEGEKLHIPAVTTKVTSSQPNHTATVQPTAISIVSTAAPAGEPTELPLSSTSAIEVSPTITATIAASSYNEYIVKKGDTLLSIADSFNTTPKAILELNQDIVNPEQLRIGQVLHIPSGQ